MMKYLLPALGLLLIAQVAWAQPQRTPADSFLRYRVNSPEQFIRQVEANPVVRQRLAKHFHLSQAELVSYLRKNLRVITVKASGRYPIYGVTSTGRIYRSSDYFRRGYRAYGLKDGTLLFKWSCGNPMVARLPKEQVAGIVQVKHTVPTPVAPPVEIASAATPPEEVPTTTASMQEWEYPAVAQLPDTPVYQVAPLVEVSRLVGLPPWLGVLPLLFGEDSSHHRVVPPPPVPEPASLLLLGAGVSLLAARSVRRRRR